MSCDIYWCECLKLEETKLNALSMLGTSKFLHFVFKADDELWDILSFSAGRC